MPDMTVSAPEKQVRAEVGTDVFELFGGAVPAPPPPPPASSLSLSSDAVATVAATTNPITKSTFSSSKASLP